MRDIHILFGFSSQQIADSITASFRALGYRVQSNMRPDKYTLKEFLDQNINIDAVILKEYIDGGDSYSIEELVDLTDNVSPSINFVVIISPKYRGKDQMKELYSAGILSAVFSDGKKGVDPDKIAELAAYSRTRREAREYYRIDRKVIKHEYLTFPDYEILYKYLADNSKGMNLIERFVRESRWVNAEQFAQFIKMLPEAAVNSLKNYKEFYNIHNQLYKKGLMEEKLKIPKDAEEGLSSNNYISHKKKEPVHEQPVITPVRSEVGQGTTMNTNFHEYIASQRKWEETPVQPQKAEQPMYQTQDVEQYSTQNTEQLVSQPQNAEQYISQTQGMEQYTPQTQSAGLYAPQPRESVPIISQNFVASDDTGQYQMPTSPPPDIQDPSEDLSGMDVDSLIGMMW